jgi:hypothetical protein
LSSLNELDRLKYNTALIELDLRLNPVTKEENDYRLYLIQIVPTLKVLDDRNIRDGERTMASSLFESSTNRFLMSSNTDSSSKQQQQNPSFDAYQYAGSSAIASRIKSVSNIAKRSAGLIDEDDSEFPNYNNMINMCLFGDKINNVYSKQEPKIEEYSTKELKEIGEREAKTFSNNNNNNLENNTSDYTTASILISTKDLNRQRSMSMNNLRALNNENQSKYCLLLIKLFLFLIISIYLCVKQQIIIQNRS